MRAHIRQNGSTRQWRQSLCLAVATATMLPLPMAWAEDQPQPVAKDQEAKPSKDYSLFNSIKSLIVPTRPVAVVSEVAAEAEEAPESDVPNLPAVTHQQATTVAVTGQNNSQWRLTAFCALPDGRLVAAVGPNPRYGSMVIEGTPAASGAKGEIQLLDRIGKRLVVWPLEFAPQTVNVGPKGTIYVGGSGKLCHLNTDGKVLACVDSPHVAESLKDEEGMRKSAEQQLEAQRRSRDRMKPMIEQMEKQLAKLEEQKAEAKEATVPLNSTLDKQIENTKRTIEAYRQITGKPHKEPTIESVIESIKGRLTAIHSMAVSPEDIFFVTAATQGYGYVVWRTNHDFAEPKLVVSSLSGCCGQMEIQCHDGCIYAAENSRHRVVKFDRDGKQLASFGKRNRTGEGEGFGSCCNPMNVRFTKGGDLYTSESNGVVKRFSPDGTFVESVGIAKVTPGCKSSIIALSPELDRIYYFDSENSKIVVLNRKADATADAGDQASVN